MTYEIIPGTTDQFPADPKGLTYTLYVAVQANTWEEAVAEMINAEVMHCYEGTVHFEEGQEEGECGTFIIAIQDSLDTDDIEHLDLLHSMYDLPEFPNLPIINLSDC